VTGGNRFEGLLTWLGCLGALAVVTVIAMGALGLTVGQAVGVVVAGICLLVGLAVRPLSQTTASSRLTARMMKMLNTPLSFRFYTTMAQLRRTIDAGVTTVRDAGGADLGMKQAVEPGLIIGPRTQIVKDRRPAEGNCSTSRWRASSSNGRFRHSSSSFRQVRALPTERWAVVARRPRTALHSPAAYRSIVSWIGVAAPALDASRIRDCADEALVDVVREENAAPDRARSQFLHQSAEPEGVTVREVE
jgi:hypothetical protein